MQFKHPELLYALFLLLIPIIIHLFQLRRFKSVPFTNVKFLKQVEIQTRKSSQLKKWLILATRLSLLAAIIIAFAQPFSSISNVFNASVENVIYLDNSFSMQAKGPSGELLQRAVQDILENFENTENISIFTNDNTFRNTSVGGIRNELLQLSYSPNQLSYQSMLSKGQGLFSQNASTIKNFVIISDFQQKENTLPTLGDSLINSHFVQVRPVNTNNIVLDTLYFENPNSNTADLVAKVSHNSNIENVPISLFNDNVLISKTTIQEDNKAIFSIPINKVFNGMLQLDDTSLQFDNSLFFSIVAPQKTNVLVINESDGNYLNRIFNQEEFNLTSVNSSQLNYNDISNQSLIVLNELDSIPNALINALNTFRNDGGYLLIIPSNNIELLSYNQVLSNNNVKIDSLVEAEKLITQINFSHPVYNEVFDSRITNFQYPKSNLSYAINNEQGALLSYEDGSPFLSGFGSTYLFTSALHEDISNFTNSPLIVPTLYNISRQSLNLPTLYYTIGNKNVYDININMNQNEILKLESSNASVIPQQQTFNNKVRIETLENPITAGIYNINDSDETIRQVSYNYNRNESVLNYFNLSEYGVSNVSNSLENTFEKIKSDSNINELWKWFVIFALIFLIIEMLILKFFK